MAVIQQIYDTHTVMSYLEKLYLICQETVAVFYCKYTHKNETILITQECYSLKHYLLRKLQWLCKIDTTFIWNLQTCVGNTKY